MLWQFCVQLLQHSQLQADGRFCVDTAGTARKAIIWSTAIHVLVALCSVYAWDGDSGTVLPPAKSTARVQQDPAALFWSAEDRPAEQPSRNQTRTPATGANYDVVQAQPETSPQAEAFPTRQPSKEIWSAGPQMTESFPSVSESQPPTSGGKYDVVVMSSPGASPYPGAEDLLSCHTVYTVYVRVAEGRDWVLQFCLKDSDQTILDSTAALIDPPYVMHAVHRDLTLAPEVEYMVIHGIINEQGRFEKLEIVGERPSTPDPEILVRTLAQWEFRPAHLDGAAVPVDTLLIVPNSVD
jgi:hypothetical protein